MDSKEIKIAVVVVTYNRLDLLKECIKAIRNQTRKLDEIMVINNSSTDGTLEWLDSQNDLNVITQENFGSAGGQYTGIKTAYEKGYDWILTMDDDAEPSLKYVEKLFKNRGSNFVLCGKVVNNNNIILFNHRGYFNKRKIFGEQIHHPSKESDYKLASKNISFSSFIGTMHHRSVIEKAGFPKKEMFIYHDDVEYSLRISKYYDINLIPDAVIIHKEKHMGYVPLLEKFINRKKYSKKKEKIILEYYANRNMVYTLKKYFSRLFFILSIMKLFYIKFRRIVFYEKYKLKLLKVLFNSFLDGYYSKFNQSNF